jgi:hypothetical protein
LNLATIKKQHSSIVKINWLMLFKEITAVYSENHTKPINAQFVKMDGNYSYYQALMD